MSLFQQNRGKETQRKASQKRSLATDKGNKGEQVTPRGVEDEGAVHEPRKKESWGIRGVKHNDVCHRGMTLR